MYGHRDQHSGDRRERHQHHRGSSSHSSRDRSKKQHRESRKERDHGGHRGSSRRVSSGGGGGGNTENERGGRGIASTNDLMAARRSSKDGSHRSRASDKKTEGFTRGSQSGRSSVSRSNSVDEFMGGKGGIDNHPVMEVTSDGSRKSEETTSTSKSFGGFVLHEAISPPSEDFESGSIKAGGFEICMPVIRSSSNDSLANASSTMRRPEDLWGAVVELRTTPVDPQPLKTPLWQRDWKPDPLTCTIPRASDASTASCQASEETDRDSSMLDQPRDRHGRNLVLHCIDMQRYIHETRDLLTTVADDQERELNPSEMVPDKPQRFYSPTSSSSRVLSCDQISRLPSVCLNQQGLTQLQKKSTASICSFSGYEWSTPEALNVLSDVLGKYLANFTKLLHMNADHCPGTNGCRGFQDALERSLHQTGMSGKEGLCKYWKEEVQGQARLLDMEADETRNACLRMMTAEEQHRSSKPPPLSSPFSSSRIFALEDQEAPDTVEEEEEEEVTLEVAMKESRAQAQVSDPYMGPPASYSALTSPDLRPPDFIEGFTPLEIDGPPSKRLRTSPLDQDWNKT